jgi:hypothetical protein
MEVGESAGVKMWERKRIPAVCAAGHRDPVNQCQRTVTGIRDK